jgi:hypothetical protein
MGKFLQFLQESVFTSKEYTSFWVELKRLLIQNLSKNVKFSYTNHDDLIIYIDDKIKSIKEIKDPIESTKYVQVSAQFKEGLIYVFFKIVNLDKEDKLSFRYVTTEKIDPNTLISSILSKIYGSLQKMELI